MNKNEIIHRSHKFAEPYCVTNDKKFRLKDVDPADRGKATSEDKPRARELLETGVQALAELQDVLYAQDRWSMLLIFQAMDAAGKDGAIKHVMSGVNPQGCQVYSFKTIGRRPQSRLSLALLEMSAGTWADWHFQPQLLRRNAGRPRPSRAAGKTEDPAAAHHK